MPKAEELPNEKAAREWMITNLIDIKGISVDSNTSVDDHERICVKIDAIIEHLKGGG